MGPPSNIVDIYRSQGWNDLASINADIANGGWVSKVQSGGGGGGGGGGGATFNPITLPQFTDLEEQAFQASKPYYVQLAKESRGDMERAKQVLVEDYQKGTREEKQKFAINQAKQQEDLQNSLASLGLTFTKEQETSLGGLNKRGFAVGEMGPNNQFNTLQPSSITPAAPGSNVANINTPANLGVGRGGVEFNRILQDQKLRQEATQRAANTNLSLLGLNLKSYTNVPEGVDINNPNIDRSQLGSSELALVRGREDLTRQQQVNEQNLFEKRRQEALSTAGQIASVGGREVPTALSNKYLQNAQTDFTNLGYSG